MIDNRTLVSQAKKVYRYQQDGYWRIEYVIPRIGGIKLKRMRIFEHRLVYGDYHKCCLLPWSRIHHINSQRGDNRIENLQGMTHSQHMKLEKSDGEARRKISERQKARMTSEIKRRLSLQMIGKKIALGRHHTDEAKKKKSLLMMGKRPSEDTRRKMSLAKIVNKHAKCRPI